MRMFGRLPHDQAAVSAAPRLYDSALLQMVNPPEKIDRSQTIITPEMYGNDTIGDCTAVAMLNAARAFSSIMSKTDLVVDPKAPFEFYGRCVGQPDLTRLGETHGAVMLDVLRQQYLGGYRISFNNDLVCNFGTVNIKNRAALADVIARLGTLYMGVSITDSDDVNFENNDPWDDDGSDTSEVIGGHATNGFWYDGLGDRDHVYVGTWARWQPATWRWVERRLKEAYGLVWRGLLPPDSADLLGFDMNVLARDTTNWSYA